MHIDPPLVINARDGATIKNSGSTTLVVTIEGDQGQRQSVNVPPEGSVVWIPPAGWRSATFSADGYPEEFRLIEP